MPPATSTQNRISSPSARNPSVAATIERSLACQILRGEHAPGSQLPAVRALAVQFGVAVPTMQRVIDRLEAAGLVSVRRGSGVRVNDPKRCSDLSMLPVWFEALADQPERVAGLLSDFLQMHRLVAADLIRRCYDEIIANAPQLVGYAAAVAAADNADDAMQADLAFTRAVVESTGQFAVSLVFNTAEKLVRAVPQLAAAYYGDRSYHRKMVRSIATVFASRLGANETADEVTVLLERWDKRCVRRFLEQLRA